MADVESLELQITGDARSAEQSIDSLIKTLDRLKIAAQGGSGLRAISNPLQKISNAVNTMSGSGQKLKDLSSGLTALSTASNFKISSNIANQINAISNAIKNSTTDYSPMHNLLAAVRPLANLGKGGLGTLIGQIKKLPEAAAELKKLDLASFGSQIEELANKMRPLADEMQKVANGFAAFPAKIQAFMVSSTKVPSVNQSSTDSFNRLGLSVTYAVGLLRKAGKFIASWINESNKYIENTNLFSVAMGEYAESAMEYADQVGDLMGIDPSDWIRSQGVFMTLAKGFGIAGDRAAIMSQQLTQLGYDLASFYNLEGGVEEAMQKLKSGFSGELEPLRNLGYDLSQAKLEAVALSLGIDKSVSSMTQAEKASLRYYAIMTQVTWVQGDMARTLHEPANQLRVLQAQVTQAARAFGSLFIPVLNAVLPVAIAVVKVITMLAQAIASLFGITLEVDFSKSSAGLSDMGASAEDTSDGLGGAAANAKKLRKILLGIDELNVLPDPASGGGGGAGGVGGGGFDFELPTYNFIDEATNQRINEITEKIKEWLGISEEINTWAEFLDTRLGRILSVVGAIAAGFALWKLSSGFISAIDAIRKLAMSPIKAITLAATLTITGFAISFAGMKDAIQDGLDGFNFAEIVGGGLVGTGGAALLGSKIATWITTAFKGSAVSKAILAAAKKLGVSTAGAVGGALGAAVSAIIVGIPAYFVGIYDAIKKGIDWLSGILIGAGATAAGAGIGAIIGMLGGPIGAGIGALIGLAVGLITDGIILLVQKVIIPNWDAIVDWLVNAGTTVGQFFSGLWKDIQDIWKDVSTWFNTNVIKPVVDFFTGLWDKISTTASECWNAIVGFFSPAFNWFSQLFDSIRQTISDVFYNIGVIASGCWEIIKAAWSVVTTWFNTSIIQPVSNFFANLWTGIQTAAINAWNGIKSVYSTIANWINTTLIQPVTSFFSNLWTGFINGAKNAWAGVQQVFSTVATFFYNTFQTAWAGVVKVFSVAGNIFVNIKNGIVSAFKTIVNGLIGGLNKVISIPFRGLNEALRKIRGFSILGLTPFSGIRSISVPTIPYLASGGVVDAGQLFVAREAGPELVANAGRKTAVMNNDQIVESVSQGVYRAFIQAMAESGSNQVVEAKVNDKVLFEVIVGRNRQETMRTGRSPLLGGA